VLIDHKGDMYYDVIDRNGNIFHQPRKIGSGWGTQRVYFPGDWNGDGRNDIITIDTAGRMWFYAGRGNATFSAKQQIGQGWAAMREVIPAGDLTGDGIPDLLAIDQQGRLFLYAGNGRGGFKYPYPQVGQGWSGYQLLPAGDINGDKRADILGVDPKGDLYFYAGRGNGTFAIKQKVGNGWNGYRLIAGADVNGDGMADIYSGTRTGMFYYKSVGGGRFAKRVAASSERGYTTSTACRADPLGCPPDGWFDPKHWNNGNSGVTTYPMTARCAKQEVERERKAARLPVCRLVSHGLSGGYEGDTNGFGAYAVRFPYAAFKYIDVRPGWVRMERYDQLATDCS